MRVLVALDGSPAADAARLAVASLPLPSGTVIEVIGVAEPTIDHLIPTLAPNPSLGAADDRLAIDLEALLDEAAASLERTGIVVRRTLLIGRPASEIVAAARELRAGLVVVGSRGRGPFASLLLGSVSAEVVDHAPCPVLVVRGPLTGPALVATDGSPSAEAAVSYLVAERLLVGKPVQVLSVAPGTPMPLAYDTTGITDIAVDAFGRKHEDAIDAARRHAFDAARRLRAGGYEATWATSEGDAAREIAAAARHFGCGLVVTGSRGLTGLSRVVLGSVARDVLLHAGVSVLVVHEPLRARRPEPTRGRLARAGEPVAG
ncbi:MAG: universal stress protein [Candidatus Limnocylindrales bacterium]